MYRRAFWCRVSLLVLVSRRARASVLAYTVMGGYLFVTRGRAFRAVQAVRFFNSSVFMRCFLGV